MSTFCDFCNDGVTEATHIITTADGARTIPVCYSCMTAFTWGQVEPQAEVTRIPEEDDDEDKWFAIKVFFTNGQNVVIHVCEGEDIEGEIANWCHWHGVPYNSVADFTTEEGEKQP